MLNTGLLKIIILCCKLIAYSGNPQTAEFELLVGNKPMGNILYKTENKIMKIYFVAPHRKKLMLTVKRIDNGLYKARYIGETKFDVDLASVYMKFNWKKLHETKKTIKLKYNEKLKIYPKGNSIYVKYGRTTFVIKKKLLMKKK